jgi:hypothetical protein
MTDPNEELAATDAAEDILADIAENVIDVSGAVDCIAALLGDGGSGGSDGWGCCDA